MLLTLDQTTVANMTAALEHVCKQIPPEKDSHVVRKEHSGCDFGWRKLWRTLTAATPRDRVRQAERDRPATKTWLALLEKVGRSLAQCTDGSIEIDPDEAGPPPWAEQGLCHASAAARPTMARASSSQSNADGCGNGTGERRGSRPSSNRRARASAP